MSYKKGDNRIYVGNLPPDVRTKDLEDLFEKYGKINYVDLKNRKGPPFAFIEFDDARDAEDAVDARDGYSYDGYKLRVEFQKGSKNGNDSDKSQISKSGSRSGPPTRRSEYRCIVTGLPTTGSWQDLKDHMREAGNVCYADVFKDGTGVVEFLRYDDMKYAARNLDDTKFRSHEGESTYIRVRMDPKYSRSESRSSRSRSRSSRRGERERATPSYSPMRRTSGSRSRSRSRSKSSRRSRSHSHRRSRSARRSSRSRSHTKRSRSKRKSKSRSRSTSRVKKIRSRTRTRSRSQSK